MAAEVQRNSHLDEIRRLRESELLLSCRSSSPFHFHTTCLIAHIRAYDHDQCYFFDPLSNSQQATSGCKPASMLPVLR